MTETRQNAKFILEMKELCWQGREDVEQTSFRKGPTLWRWCHPLAPVVYTVISSQFASLPPCGRTCCAVKHWHLVQHNKVDVLIISALVSGSRCSVSFHSVVRIFYCRLYFKRWQLPRVVFLFDLSWVRNPGREKKKRYLLWITTWQLWLKLIQRFSGRVHFVHLIIGQSRWVSHGADLRFTSSHVRRCVYFFIFTHVDDYLDFGGKKKAITLPENPWQGRSDCECHHRERKRKWHHPPVSQHAELWWRSGSDVKQWQELFSLESTTVTHLYNLEFIWKMSWERHHRRGWGHYQIQSGFARAPRARPHVCSQNRCKGFSCSPRLSQVPGSDLSRRECNRVVVLIQRHRIYEATDILRGTERDLQWHWR